jgi:uncharacterized protein YutE (UPF0331/DUF86 family)
MSPKTRDIILSKLTRLDEYVSYLKELKRYTRTQFIQDYRIHGLAERYLQLSIEVTIDVSRLLLICFELERPENNHEAFELLYKNKLISKKLFEKIRNVAGFRNILVHDYMKIDHAIVYRALQDGIKNFEEFKKTVVKNIARNF